MVFASKASIPKVLKASVILFPGQGSQHVGMVNNLSSRGRSLFEMANQVLGYDLLALCRNGPEEQLNKTVHAQPAIFVASLAAVERLAEMSIGAVEHCKATAGFSVGEFASLVMAQSIDFVDALKLVKLRAEVTQALCEAVPSGMLTVISGGGPKIRQAVALAAEYCVRSGLSKEESVCSISNYLFPHGVVIGGHQKALEFVEQNAKDFGVRRMKRLAVSGAFHTSLMRPASEDLKKALNSMKIKDPKIRVYSNIDATPYIDADHIRKAIPRHVYRPVMWEKLIQRLYSDVRVDDQLPITFECGPQNNMTTLLGMVNLKAKKLAFNIEP